jgi:hypothetical protein
MSPRKNALTRGPSPPNGRGENCTRRVMPGSGSDSCTVSAMAALAAKISILLAPPVLVCDPVFVAEMPESRGQLLKIGHFDEIRGVMHVEI